MPLLQVNHLKKVYTTRFGGNKVEALRDISFTIEQGEYTAIMGESGSGKTTLLNLLASVDRPTDGEIYLPLVLAGKKYDEMAPKLTKIAGQLGIADLLKKYPYEVSGGQKQRVAVARAMITEPDIILADEPTGALDSRSSSGLLKIFSKIHEAGQTILMVTHSVKAASHASRVLFIKDGEIFHQLYRGGLSNEEMYKKISDTLTVLLSGGEQNE